MYLHSPVSNGLGQKEQAIGWEKRTRNPVLLSQTSTVVIFVVAMPFTLRPDPI